jgi:hypothetical protein
MAATSIPYFDRRMTYSSDIFKDSIIQTYIALFISKPDLYKDIYSLHETEKQSYFFKKFRLFLLKYYLFNIEKEFDLMTYFGDLQINKKGSVSVCGGGDASKNSRKNALKSFNNSCQNTSKNIEYLYSKYKININSEIDEREFIGIREIWKNPSPKLLQENGWEWVLEQDYDDITFSAHLPDILNKYLVPLDIRNKAYQKWKNQKAKINEIAFKTHGYSETESETDIEENVKNVVNKEEANIFVISEDLQREIDDLF